MSFIVTFIAAVFVFSAVIAIHEFGHFMVAKLCGVQVNEFSIGMGAGAVQAGAQGHPVQHPRPACGRLCGAGRGREP